MLKVYRTKKLIEEIGSAKIIQKGFEVTLYNGDGKYLLINSGYITGAFSTSSDGLATYLGELRTHQFQSYKLIDFNTNKEDERAYLFINNNQFSLNQIYEEGGLSA